MVEVSRVSTIATDGSCRGNPGPGGWAWVADDTREASGGVEYATSNQMELRAVLEALKAFPTERILIESDSKYVVNIFSSWLKKWKKNGMNTGSGPVKNPELILAIETAIGRREVKFVHVPGHSGHVMNERADLLATTASATATGKG